MAPSAQFLAAARPMEAYNFSPQLRWGSDDPRPPSPAWTETSHEKVQTTAQFQRDYEAGRYYAI
ncbi:hypothetical protein M422DRAFT_34974 [Sphaerobolus stellatus SS14]|uniref:Uncharacterized protein n=1 Tax=Sphaerobolus stellatus (strain SS14) TaxID=990650 RepID=A0A0C9VBC5_SPHS4|nr:hypothetical protein M422DRAFT_37781 [Sphaerobolus stellatus SS14]KIJ34616.1 hypothetical protein M422DRAFT_34974 [Sphaerobolus stellatus SS14]